MRADLHSVAQRWRARWAPPVGITPEGERSGGVGVERLAGVQCVRGDAQVAECAVAMTGRRLVRSSALVAPAAQD